MSSLRGKAVHEPVEQVAGVVGPGAGLRVVLDGRRRHVAQYEALDRPVVEVQLLELGGAEVGFPAHRLVGVDALLCRAVGLETFKLPFGHRGANHPVKDLETGRIEITSQNHGFAVLGPGGQRTIDGDEAVRWETDFGAAELQQLNLYDRTVEGLVLRDVEASTVQYHPEAGPGPHDARHLFDRFVERLVAA